VAAGAVAALESRGLSSFRQALSPEGLRRAAAEVRAAWAAGWRDPYSVQGAPLTWGELTGKVCWQRRLVTVDFPRWTAVLLKPDGIAT